MTGEVIRPSKENKVSFHILMSADIIFYASHRTSKTVASFSESHGWSTVRPRK